MTPQERSEFKAKAHSLKPVVWVADKGLSETVMAEIENALTSHELIKVKISGQERELKAELINQICEKTQSALVQSLGHIATLYRKAPPKEAPIKKIIKNKIKPKTRR